MGQKGNLWLIVAVVGVALLLIFCIYGVHFTPDMSQSPDEFQKAFGALTLCGGPICLLVAGFLFLIGR